MKYLLIAALVSIPAAANEVSDLEGKIAQIDAKIDAQDAKMLDEVLTLSARFSCGSKDGEVKAQCVELSNAITERIYKLGVGRGKVLQMREQ